MESEASEGEEPDHGIVDSSDDENEFEEEPATQKGQGIDNARINCASHEPAVPTAMGDESPADETPCVRHLWQSQKTMTGAFVQIGDTLRWA